jgi:hypothetical protein
MFKIVQNLLSKALPNEIHNIVDGFLYESILESQIKWCRIFEDTLSIMEECRFCENCKEIKSNKLLNNYFCSNLCYSQFLHYETSRKRRIAKNYMG